MIGFEEALEAEVCKARRKKKKGVKLLWCPGSICRGLALLFLSVHNPVAFFFFFFSLFLLFLCSVSPPSTPLPFCVLYFAMEAIGFGPSCVSYYVVYHPSGIEKKGGHPVLKVTMVMAMVTTVCLDETP